VTPRDYLSSVWGTYTTHREDIVPLLTFVVGLATVLVGSLVARAALNQAKTARERHREQTSADLQRRITESFTKAVEQLARDKIEVRLGGIYALERISRESELDYWPVMEILTAFARERTCTVTRGGALRCSFLATSEAYPRSAARLDPKGLLIFMPDGHYASMIMRSDRPKFSTSSRLQGTPDENRSMVHGKIATFGRYTVDEEKKAFKVRFEGSTFPNNEGTEQTRQVTISGDELKIQNPASTIGGTTELTYRRAK
jgi:hypothetical protein